MHTSERGGRYFRATPSSLSSNAGWASSLSAVSVCTTVPRSKTALQRLIAEKERDMRAAAKDLNFELAGILRDEIRELNKKAAAVEEVMKGAKIIKKS